MDCKQAVLEVARFYWLKMFSACRDSLDVRSAPQKKLPQLNMALHSAGGSWYHDRLKAMSLCLVSPWFSAHPLYQFANEKKVYLLTWLF